MSTEKDRIAEIKEAGKNIAEAAEIVRQAAEKLRSDVDNLTVRVSDLEGDQNPASSQAAQDLRLDNLESNGNN